MSDFYVGAHDLVWMRRPEQPEQPAVLEDQRHACRALIHLRAVRSAYENPGMRRFHRSHAAGASLTGGVDIAGGDAGVDQLDPGRVSLIVDLLHMIWPWAAFALVKNHSDPPRRWRLRIYCTALSNPGPGQSLPRLERGSVYVLLEPTAVRPEIAGYQAFECDWTRGRDTRRHRRELAADPWRGGFLQNTDLQNTDRQNTDRQAGDDD